ncbi:6-phosphogluconolactonase [Pseudolysinimonas kribbensis]|uniref:6-phosphogluconolactonase n=1 Tax=Pseudolysinimonas kribbensis TaxID=433641 RepID=A0ABQ6K9S0_9MICO|nr:6-phosphogluconolactonase [Pseudolysinimonas kribbensis]
MLDRRLDGLRGPAGDRRLPACGTVDWKAITFWWGDERYLPHGDPDRNDTQSKAALLDALNLDAAQIKSLPAPGEHPDIHAAADAYAAELLAGAPEGAGTAIRRDLPRRRTGRAHRLAVPRPCRHPRHGARRHRRDRLPKPPPERLSLTLPIINASDRVWMVLAGSDKAGALGLALAGASASSVPVAGVEGRRRTVFFVDQEAAAEVPANLIAPSYYWTGEDDKPEE